ncbi:MAG: hypothetical protein RLZZ214_2752 [Verrucomicrobiota bacterium]
MPPCVPAIKARPKSLTGARRGVLKWFTTPCLILAIALPTAAAPPRGIWWWTSPDHPWGSAEVIGNPAKEAEVLRFLADWEVGVIYTCFSDQARTRPELIRGWNERVHAAGKTSQLLLSENTWIAPEHRSKLLENHLQHELIDFNSTADSPRQRFDGVHLDIEPHGLPGWKTMTPEARKDLLFQFRDTLREVRAYLDAHGAGKIPVFADLPVWFDQVEKPVGWVSAAERDAWFADLEKSLAGISLMAYERNTAAKIESGVIWELENFKDEVRVGLEVSVGRGKTWKSIDELVSMIKTQESAKPSRAVDIHDLIQFHDAVTAKPD